MKIWGSKILIAATVLSVGMTSVSAESLFTGGVSHNAYPINPKSLFSSVKAKSIGDLVTVIVKEQVSTSDDLKLTVKEESKSNDSFSGFLNKLYGEIFNSKEKSFLMNWLILADLQT